MTIETQDTILENSIHSLITFLFSQYIFAIEILVCIWLCVCYLCPGVCVHTYVCVYRAEEDIWILHPLLFALPLSSLCL